ncbi:MAG: NUDIX domain-containing protein [Bacteroidia bacterium]|nr:NUDIX domain-containing protein [Bacteroidia bacterium]
MRSEIYKNYSKHYVAVDCSIFGYEASELKLLLYPRAFEPERGKWSLMGGFVQEDESLEDAARRVLLQTTGLHDIYLEKASAFSLPYRDPGSRVISMTFVALVRIDLHDKELVRESGAKWWPVTRLPELIFDHEEMVQNALDLLQQKALINVIGQELLPEMFTLTQLRNLYEAIFQKTLDPGNFRKKILSLEKIERLNEKNTTESKKGAFYYRFIDNHPAMTSEKVIKFPL